MNSDNRVRRLFTGKERLALLADNGEETYAGEETYDERVARLRQDCRRLTALIAYELNAPAMEIERFYRKHLGFGQAGATLAQLEHKHDVLRRKAGELRMAVD